MVDGFGRSAAIVPSVARAGNDAMAGRQRLATCRQ
jgi:hypothetical protein